MTSTISRTRRSRSPSETEAIAFILGARLGPGDLVALTGDLGAGKTVFTRGLAKGLGVASGVKSPTFVLVREYEGRYPVLHADAYRLDGSGDWEGLGIEDRRETAVIIVEWADRIAAAVYSPALSVRIEDGGGMEDRILTISGDARILQALGDEEESR